MHQNHLEGFISRLLHSTLEFLTQLVCSGTNHMPFLQVPR